MRNPTLLLAALLLGCGASVPGPSPRTPANSKDVPKSAAVAEEGQLDTTSDATPAGERDGDRDGIPDRVDFCPDEPESVNGLRDHDGCPDPEPVRSDAPVAFDGPDSARLTQRESHRSSRSRHRLVKGRRAS